MTPINLDQQLSLMEKRFLIAALKAADHNRTVAAKLLSISRSTLHKRMAKHRITHTFPARTGVAMI